MKDRCLEAYEAALRTLPEEQRHAFQLLMNAHGLHPDDPSIIAVTLSFMLTEQQRKEHNAVSRDAISAMAEFKRIAKLPSAQHLVGFMMSFYAGTREALVAASLATTCFLALAGITGVTVHNYDDNNMHARVCAAEVKYITQITESARQSGKSTISDWIAKHQASPECSDSGSPYSP